MSFDFQQEDKDLDEQNLDKLFATVTCQCADLLASASPQSQSHQNQNRKDDQHSIWTRRYDALLSNSALRSNSGFQRAGEPRGLAAASRYAYSTRPLHLVACCGRASAVWGFVCRLKMEKCIMCVVVVVLISRRRLQMKTLARSPPVAMLRRTRAALPQLRCRATAGVGFLLAANKVMRSFLQCAMPWRRSRSCSITRTGLASGWTTHLLFAVALATNSRHHALIMVSIFTFVFCCLCNCH